jgi:hypothetical protein
LGSVDGQLQLQRSSWEVSNDETMDADKTEVGFVA